MATCGLGHDGCLCGFCYTREIFPVWCRFLGAAALATIARSVEIASSLVAGRSR
ncbi:quinoprotein ethanol dehydrogenase [Pseudomonas mandelii JR-1]|uniref:Quinoprotein ethanol dehydrogenase n=1 Tax=Pseudomonas mandelii JR-1 TaxID=1147786 RepID=A0A024EKU7_9PSED|nr:quinoprotein ethanol dehydrogenase [Pseudomonas mandelii JR-1]